MDAVTQPSHKAVQILPGTVLESRYRLDVCLEDGDDTQFWRGQDTVIGRRVGVRLVDAESAELTIGAARKLASINDMRVLTVLDTGLSTLTVSVGGNTATQDDRGNDPDGDQSGDNTPTADSIDVTTESDTDTEGSSPVDVLSSSSCTEDREVGFVVYEFIDGTPLERLVSEDPLEPHLAKALIGEAAQALDKASVAGLHHGCLVPDRLMLTRFGDVRIIGTAVDGAAVGIAEKTADDAQRQDVIQLVGLLYLALTGIWPRDAILAAEQGRQSEAYRPPRLLNSIVPRELDDLCNATLNADQHPKSLNDLVKRLAPWNRRQLSGTVDTRPQFDPEAKSRGVPTDPRMRIVTPSQSQPDATANERHEATMIDMLTSPVGHRRPPQSFFGHFLRPDAAPVMNPLGTSGDNLDHDEPQVEKPPAPTRSGPITPDAVPVVRRDNVQPHRSGDRTTAHQASTFSARRPLLSTNRNLLLIAAAVAAVLLLFGVVSLLGDNNTTDTQASDGRLNPQAEELQSDGVDDSDGSDPTQDTSPSEVPTASLAITSAVPLDPLGDKSEHNSRAGRAIDRNSRSFWNTSTYRSSTFGGLKSGVGLAVELQQESTIRVINVKINGSGGAFEVRAADSASYSKSTKVGDGVPNGSTVTVEFSEPVTTKWVILWFTELPKASRGGWRAEVAEVSVQ